MTLLFGIGSEGEDSGQVIIIYMFLELIMHGFYAVGND